MKTRLLVATFVAGAASVQASNPPPAAAAPPAAPAASAKPGVKVFEGMLQTGIVAVGGETTGIILKTKEHGRYELELNKNADLLKLAEKFNGKRVVVEGDYKPRPGVEVKERRIILVKSIKKAP